MLGLRLGEFRKCPLHPTSSVHAVQRTFIDTVPILGDLLIIQIFQAVLLERVAKLKHLTLPKKFLGQPPLAETTDDPSCIRSTMTIEMWYH